MRPSLHKPESVGTVNANGYDENSRVKGDLIIMNDESVNHVGF